LGKTKSIKGNTIVISGTFSGRRRKFNDKALLDMIIYLKSCGYTLVFVGLTKLQETRYGVYNINYDKYGLNLINSLTYAELLKIIDEASLVISPDGGLIHIAGLTDTPIMGLYTIINEKCVSPIRNNKIGYKCYNIKAPIHCYSCYTKTNDFYQCLQHEGKVLQFLDSYNKLGDADCVLSITSDVIIDKLKEVLKEIK